MLSSSNSVWMDILRRQSLTLARCALPVQCGAAGGQSWGVWESRLCRRSCSSRPSQLAPRLCSYKNGERARCSAQGMIWTSRTLTLLGTASVISAPALCEDKDSDIDRSLSKIKKSARKDAKKTEDVHLSNEMDKLAREVGEKVEEILATGIPGQISYGFVSGFCSGYALKKVGRAGAITFGFGFCALQTLSYAGYIHLDYDKIARDVTRYFDVNQDGKVDRDDAHQIMNKVLEVLTFNLPAGSGFGAGFVAGIRSG